MGKAKTMIPRARYLEVTAVVLGLLGLIWAVFAWAVAAPRNTPFNVFLKDEKGLPGTDLILVGPDGDKRLPDASGMVHVPSTWNGSVVSVRKQSSWTEILTVTVVRSHGGTTTITVPR